MDINGLLRTIQNLLPAIRTWRQEVEQARCMPRDLVDELQKTKMSQIPGNKCFGKNELRNQSLTVDCGNTDEAANHPVPEAPHGQIHA
jgi:hypothetical protein